VVSCLHQLVQIAIHVLHAYMKLLGIGIQEDIEGPHEVSMAGQRLEEDDFSKLEARRKGFEGLFHRFDSDLWVVSHGITSDSR